MLLYPELSSPVQGWADTSGTYLRVSVWYHSVISSSGLSWKQGSEPRLGASEMSGERPWAAFGGYFPTPQDSWNEPMELVGVTDVSTLQMRKLRC